MPWVEHLSRAVLGEILPTTAFRRLGLRFPDSFKEGRRVLRSVLPSLREQGFGVDRMWAKMREVGLVVTRREFREMAATADLKVAGRRYVQSLSPTDVIDKSVLQTRESPGMKPIGHSIEVTWVDRKTGQTFVKTRTWDMPEGWQKGRVLHSARLRLGQEKGAKYLRDTVGIQSMRVVDSWAYERVSPFSF